MSGCHCKSEKRAPRLLRWLALRVLGFSDHAMVAEGHLTARVFRVNGGPVEEYDLGYNTIVTAGVAFLCQDFVDGTTEITNLNYHAWGTGCAGTPSACAVTALTLESAEARVAGVRSLIVVDATTRGYRSVATITASAPRIITEWALLSQLAVGGTAWSVRCFFAAPINLAAGDSIEFTYQVNFACVLA
jgi:hypothetical protein